MWKCSEHLHLNNTLFAAVASISGFFAPIANLIWALVFFVIADFVTGVWASRRAGEMWESGRFRQSVGKVGAYMFTIICAHIFQDVVPLDLQIEGYIAAFVCGVEFYSILENLYKGTGNRVFYILTQLTNRKLKDTVGYTATSAKGKTNEKTRTNKQKSFS